MTDLVFYLLVFFAVGVFFLFIHLLIGKLIRPNRPDAEKMTIYECGEPTVGSAWIQFDLRYYVVALLFVVFDVEVAFFFPWAVVFGKANELSRLQDSPLAWVIGEEPAEKRPGVESDVVAKRRAAITRELVPAELNLVYLERSPKKAGAAKAAKKQSGPAPAGAGDPKKTMMANAAMMKGGGGMGMPKGGVLTKAKPPDVQPIDAATAKSWAWIAFFDILVFFSVLMVGFAYLWRRGDIDWVRSTTAEADVSTPLETPASPGVGIGV